MPDNSNEVLPMSARLIFFGSLAVLLILFVGGILYLGGHQFLGVPEIAADDKGSAMNVSYVASSILLVMGGFPIRVLTSLIPSAGGA